jgi:hypothetical protein
VNQVVMDESLAFLQMFRVGQNHIYTVYIRCFWQGNHQIYGVYIRFWPTLQMLSMSNTGDLFRCSLTSTVTPQKALTLIELVWCFHLCIAVWPHVCMSDRMYVHVSDRSV